MCVSTVIVVPNSVELITANAVDIVQDAPRAQREKPNKGGGGGGGGRNKRGAGANNEKPAEKTAMVNGSA